MRDHERIEELLSAQVLGALDAADERELSEARADHGGACEDCARIERELSEVAGILPFALTPVPTDPRIADRILGATESSGVTMLPEGPPVAVDEFEARRAGRRTRAWTALVGVAAVLVALFIVASTVLTRPVEVTSADLSGRLVRFETQGVDGTLAMAYTPGEPGAVFWGHGLPDPGEGRTLEIWMIEGDTAVSGGCATPVDGRVAIFVDAEIGTTDTMAVTVESTECPPAPTGEPVAIAPL